MPRVICVLPNASLEINGVPFTKLDDGRFLSEDVEQAIADFFLSIPGYVVDGADALDTDTDKAPEVVSGSAKPTGRKAANKPAQAAKPAAAAPVAPVVPQETTAPVNDPVDPVDTVEPPAESTEPAANSETPDTAPADGEQPPAGDVF